MTMGMVKDDQAAGRVFCNYALDLEYMVWTQNDGRLMGYVAGPVHTNVWDWWVAVHQTSASAAPHEHVQLRLPTRRVRADGRDQRHRDRRRGHRAGRSRR